MKKILALVLSLLFVLSFTACGNNTTTETVSNDATVAETVADNDVKTETVKADDSTDDAEWKEFLKDYEAWVDDYIEIVEKYNADPTDMSILSDYTEMVSELADWTDRAEKIEAELEDPEVALEYTTELAKIADKLAKVAQ